MPDKRLVILLGHSHMGALVHAVTRRTPVGRADREMHIVMYEAWKFGGEPPYLVTDADGSQRFNPAVMEAAQPFIDGAGRPIVIAMFGGNDWSVLSMVRHERPLDFVLPEAPGLPLEPGAEIVPCGYIRSVLQSLTDRYMYQLYQLRLAVGDPIFAVVPPPPIADTRFLEEKLDDFFFKNSRSRSITTPFVRLKMWLLQRAIQQRLCDEQQIAMIEVPPAAVTAEGFLAPDYYGEDATHANPAYGELVLRQIEAVAGAPQRSWYWFS